MTKSKQKTLIGYPIFDMLAIIFCFAFVVLAICLYNYTSIIFVFTIAFFGFGGVALLLKWVKGKQYISNNSIKAQELANQRNDTFINDLGDFTYDTQGFTIIISKKKRTSPRMIYYRYVHLKLMCLSLMR